MCPTPSPECITFQKIQNSVRSKELFKMYDIFCLLVWHDRMETLESLAGDELAPY